MENRKTIKEFVSSMLSFEMAIYPRTAQIWSKLFGCQLNEMNAFLRDYQNMIEGQKFFFDEGDDVKIFFKDVGIVSDRLPDGRLVKTSYDAKNEMYEVTVMK